MNDRTFVDTNVLVYAHDVDAKSKHQAAKDVLRDLWNTRSGALSVQVLQEFYVNVTRKIPRPISKGSARQVVNAYAVWCIDTTAAEISKAFQIEAVWCIDTTAAEISKAFQIEDGSKIGFWDALIVASALKSGATRILSEDLNAGQVIAGIRVENPFAKAP